jgi:hypothetical protein
MIFYRFVSYYKNKPEVLFQGSEIFADLETAMKYKAIHDELDKTSKENAWNRFLRDSAETPTDLQSFKDMAKLQPPQDNPVVRLIEKFEIELV